MGIKQNLVTGEWEAFFSKRHPITRMPLSRRRIKLESRSVAVRTERELIGLVERLLHQSVVPSWSTVVEQFLTFCLDRGLTKDTVYDYEVTLRAHTFEEWGHRCMDEITTQDVRILLDKKVGHRSASHKKNVLKFIRGVFNYAVELGVLNRNPTPQLKFRIGDKVKKVLTADQVRSFLEKAKTLDWEWYPHWVMAVYTGMRNGELYALTWPKVNLDDRLIKVDSSWNDKNGFKSTKSGDDRVIEIAPNLVTFLKQFKLRNGDTHFVLPRVDGWDKGKQARELGLFLKANGMPMIRFHDLRATWATLLLSKGVEPIKVMKMGGWKDMKTMMIYVRTAGVDIRGATDCLDLHNPIQGTGTVHFLDARSTL